jgi:hypothetical protein
MALEDTPNDSNESEFSLLSEVQRIYYLNLLTLKKAKWDRESMDQAIIEAKVDLNPHQVEAATFAFRNPLAGGVSLGSLHQIVKEACIRAAFQKQLFTCSSLGDGYTVFVLK